MKQIQTYLLLVLVVWFIPVHAAELPASVQWDQRTVMGTLASGVVKKIPVKRGQKVRKGELLLALDNGALYAAIDQAKAQADYAKLLLEEAQREDARSQELYDRTVLSEHERVLSKIALSKAKAEHASAKAALAKARKNLRDSELRAPFNALVVQINAQIGQTVASMTEVPVLVVLASQDSMRVQLNTNLATAQSIAQAGQVDVVVAGQRYPATDVQVGLEAATQGANGALYSVTARFQPNVPLVGVGQTATLVW